MLIKCPECGRDVSDRSQMCLNCGYPVELMIKGEIIESKEEQEVLANPVLCKNCGTENHPDADYCVKCNMRMKPYVEPQDGKRKSKKKEKAPGLEEYLIVILGTLFIPPLGLWLSHHYKAPKKKALYFIIAGFWLFIWLFVLFVDDDTDTTHSDSYIESSESIETEYTKTVKINEKEESAKEDINFKDELATFNSGEYHYITNEDLSKYHVNMIGQKFYTIIEIDDIKETVIKSTLDDGYMMSKFNCLEDYSYTLKKGDSIAIMGVIGEFDDYGFMGKSLNFDECMVFAVKEDTDKYLLDKSDESFDEFFVVTEEVAKANNEISEDEFKNICKELNYEDILRNPDSYKNEYCKLSGTVSQTIEGWLGSYTIYIKDSSGDIWGCTYSYKENESHVLEGDYVTVYGMCDGTRNSETVLGKQVTMPYIKIKYMD